MIGGKESEEHSSECLGIFRENAVLIISTVLNANKSLQQKKKFIYEGLILCMRAGQFHSFVHTCMCVFEP